MSLKESLTPKNTEEVKPNLFLQKTTTGKYRQVFPACWNGKINWNNFIMGGNFWRNFIFFVILMMIVFSYVYETQTCREFQENPCNVLTNLTNYCYGDFNVVTDGSNPLNNNNKLVSNNEKNFSSS